MGDQAEDQFWQDMYSRVATFPHSWLGKATKLLDAANLTLVQESEGPLKGHYRNLDIYMMLTAFAFENVLGAIVLTRHPETANDANKMNNLFRKHDLCDLALRAQVSCTADETDLLHRLSRFIYTGRYPIPKKWSQYKGQLDGSGSVAPSVFKLPHDLIQIVDFIHKLEEELKRLGIVYCDLYDLSYSFTRKGDIPITITRRISPHPFNTTGIGNGDTEDT